MADGRLLRNRSGSRSSKTFKPKKNIPEGTHQYDLMKHAAATLGSGNLRLAVMLPDGEDQNEWVAVNSEYSHSCRFPESRLDILFVPFQLLTSSIRSTCCTAQSQNFAQKKVAPSCLLAQSTNTTGQMVKQLRNPSNVLLQSTLTTSWPGCRISWMMKIYFHPKSVSHFIDADNKMVNNSDTDWTLSWQVFHSPETFYQ